MKGATKAQPNRLLNERSPYLQQHAYNPVDWYPWGEEAFEKGRSEGKPIFLSIGYSTCHWCHVMERESFEDQTTADLMNELFINIKVDREERPDVDAIYMSALQALTGQGGWPLSAWLTPELKPYYLGTYFPPRSMYGRPSFREALRQLRRAWDEERDRVLSSSEAILNAVQRGAEISDAGIPTVVERSPEETFTPLAELTFERLKGTFDEQFGGFGSAPKFPRPTLIDFLFRYHAISGEEDGLKMALFTLKRMASGGIYDHVGGGFSRYSVDAEWRVPHFEKMLYDQGQLLSLYAEAYRITGDPQLAETIRQTVGYLRRDLQDESGAFYAAEDADSEGEEGKFYVWKVSELQPLLSDRELQALTLRYGISDNGNFEGGTNILHTSTSIQHISEELGIPDTEVANLLNSAKQKLFRVREKRVRPSRDEKIVTAWNGLAISGLAKCGGALDDATMREDAERVATVLLERLTVEGRLMRRMAEGEVKFPGYLDDYAFFAQGLLDLYEVTFNERWLREGERLIREAITLFADQVGGGFFMTAEGSDPNLLVRAKSDHDGAEPSGNSVMAMNLLRLGRLFEEPTYRELAERTIRLFTHRITEYPDIMPMMVSASIALTRPSGTIVIAVSEADQEGTERLMKQVRRKFLPYTSVVVTSEGSEQTWLAERVLPSLAEMKPVEGFSVAYVCENFTCKAPTTSFEVEENLNNR
ncbi:MAG: thioredoxin domain-containing protein [Ignavibacteriae bacterium]|nr:thioredoxin domain-containing protein [Ignavibacteriota bacterium]MCB9215606.1 thioredoxin domain-containing protein [Ignavibacteria bacterium]